MPVTGSLPPALQAVDIFLLLPYSLACSKNRFVLFHKGAQSDGIVVQVGWPKTFASFQELSAAAGGIQGIIHPPTLHRSEGGVGEQELMDHLYGEGFEAAGYHGVTIERTLYPWLQSGCASADSIERYFQRLLNCCLALQEVWKAVGLADALDTPLPSKWHPHTAGDNTETRSSKRQRCLFV